MMPYRLVMSAMSRGREWQQVSPAIPGRPGWLSWAPLSTWWPLGELHKKTTGCQGCGLPSQDGGGNRHQPGNILIHGLTSQCSGRQSLGRLEKHLPRGSPYADCGPNTGNLPLGGTRQGTLFERGLSGRNDCSFWEENNIPDAFPPQARWGQGTVGSEIQLGSSLPTQLTFGTWRTSREGPPGRLLAGWKVLEYKGGTR